LHGNISREGIYCSVKKKKRQAPHIAPLQPHILAAFRPWGGSAGAGRVRPAAAKIMEK